MAAAGIALVMAGYFGYNANLQKKAAKKAQLESETALTNFRQEQAEKERLIFNALESRANTILNTGGCPKDIFQEMRELAKSHPDSLIFKDKLKLLSAKNITCQWKN